MKKLYLVEDAAGVVDVHAVAIVAHVVDGAAVACWLVHAAEALSVLAGITAHRPLDAAFPAHEPLGCLP